MYVTPNTSNKPRSRSPPTMRTILTAHQLWH
jgi:hypothetical protein